jgi:hypothetical protein
MPTSTVNSPARPGEREVQPHRDKPKYGSIMPEYGGGLSGLSDIRDEIAGVAKAGSRQARQALALAAASLLVAVVALIVAWRT